jgi:cephalosporin hydroxylase
MIMQEIIWDVKPDLIIETGVAYGGSVVFYASMMELLNNNGIVIGIDIDFSRHLDAIQKHPQSKRVMLVEGSSTNKTIIKDIQHLVQDRKVLVVLDSDHSHAHVLDELNAYAPLVAVGSYCVVFATIIEDLPEESRPPNVPWRKGNNPKTAVHEFLKHNSDFEINKELEKKLIHSTISDGFLRRVK